MGGKGKTSKVIVSKQIEKYKEFATELFHNGELVSLENKIFDELAKILDMTKKAIFYLLNETQR